MIGEIFMANPLVAQREDSTEGFSGIAIAESVVDTKKAIEEGDWLGGLLGVVGTSLDALGMAMDPFGAILAAGVGWLIEHVGPLSDALDELTGDPDQIKAHSETWKNVATELGKIKTELAEMVKKDTAEWRGEAGDSYRKSAANTNTLITAAETAASGASDGVGTAGEVVAAVRTLVRDIIAETVGHLISWALQVACTLGLAMTWVMPQVVAHVAKVASKIADIVKKLVEAMKKLVPLLKKLGDGFKESANALKKIKADGGTAGGPKPGGKDKNPPKDEGTSKGNPEGPASTNSQSADGPPSKNGPPPGGDKGGQQSTNDGPESTSSQGANGQGGKNNGPTGSTSGHGGREGGQRSEGNGGCDGTGGDPVDAVSGQMITSHTDLGLPGLLPLDVHRAYSSGFADGGLLGPGWSSTVDQRLELTADGYRYIGDDAQVLVYEGHGDGSRLPLFGARWVLTRESESDTYRIEDPESGWTRHFGPSTGDIRPITALTDRDGHMVTYTRDPDGLPLEIRHSGGYHVAVEVDGTARGPRLARLRLIDEQDQAVTVADYQYDERGRLAGIVNSSGLPYLYEYDEQDRITAWVDRNGFSYHYEYGPDGRVSRGHSVGGYLNASFHYDLANRVTAVTNSLGDITYFHYDEHNHLTKTVDPLGNITLNEFDRYHRLLSVTDPLGNTTRYVRDHNGDVIRTEYPDGNVTEVEYDRRSRMPAVVTQPGGVVWRHSYSDTDSLLTTTDPLGAVTTSELDARGHLAASVGPDGGRLTFTSDDTGRPLSVMTASGALTRYTMDRFGRLSATALPDGGVTRYGWTVEGKLAWQVTPDGAREELSYDPEGNLLTRRSETGGITRFEVGPFNLPVARTGPDGTRYTFEYTTELRLARVINPLGLSWDYEYDAAGRLIRESDFTGREVRYRYDAAGQLIGRTDGAGEEVELVHDELGRTRTRSVVGEAPIEYSYDEAGGVARISDGTTEIDYRYDALGRTLAESINGHTVHNEYDVLGRRIKRVTPSGVETSWEHAPSRLPTTMVGTEGRLDFEFDIAGRETARQLGPQARLSQHYDALGRLTAQDVWSQNSAQPVQSRSFRYRPDGVLSAMGDWLHGDREYRLSPAGRVLAVTGANWQEQYAYDAIGNIAAARPGADNDTAGPRVLDGVLLRSAGRSSYEYDDTGRLVRQTRRTLSGQRRIWTYEWNGHQQLTGVTTPDGTRWRYVYDPLGRRVAKKRLDQRDQVVDETLFHWDGAELAEQWHTSNSRVTAQSWDYQSGVPLAQTTRSWLADAPGEVIASRFDAIVSDLVGTPTELINANGRVSWQRQANLWGEEFGVRAEQGADCPLRFPGQYHDRESGLHYNVHRYYDPATGRYLSADPIGLSPSQNNYTYVAHPLLLTDPLGLMPTHNRKTEYPNKYLQSTHDKMAQDWTSEGHIQGKTPVDSNNKRIPRNQLEWMDRNGNPVDPKDMTYEHKKPVVNHWIDEGHNQDKKQRTDFYNDTHDMEAMGRSENSSDGAKMKSRYSDKAPGPKYSCR